MRGAAEGRQVVDSLTAILPLTVAEQALFERVIRTGELFPPQCTGSGKVNYCVDYYLEQELKREMPDAGFGTMGTWEELQSTYEEEAEELIREDAVGDYLLADQNLK
jgi:hypothetical protein